MDAARVTAKKSAVLLCCQIPHAYFAAFSVPVFILGNLVETPPDRAVETRGRCPARDRQRLAVRAERNGINFEGIDPEYLFLLARRDIPQSHSQIAAACRGQSLAVRAEGYRKDRAFVRLPLRFWQSGFLLQRGTFPARLNVPQLHLTILTTRGKRSSIR